MTAIRRLFVLFAALAAALLAAPPAAADYVIYTKDGARILAREKPTTQGNRLLFRTPLGTQQSIPLADFDEQRTEKANKEGLGGAYVLSDTPDTKVIPAPADKKPSLSEYIRQNKKIMKVPGESLRGLADEPTVEPAKAPAGAGTAKGAEIPSAAVDLQVTAAFGQAFEGAGLRGLRVSSIPRGVRLQSVTDTEQQVLGAVAAAARGLKESRAMGRPIEKVEMYLVTSGGENAGRFEISPDQADALLNGRITPAKYFVSSVIF